MLSKEKRKEFTKGMKTLVLEKDKVTKNGIVRFADADNHNIYLKPEEVQELGNPNSLKVTLEKSS